MSLTVSPLEGIPEIREDSDFIGELNAGLEPLEPEDGDLVCIAQKIVSKWEGRTRRLDEFEPGPMARRYAPEIEKDPRLVQAIFDHSDRVIKMSEEVIITETPHGFVCANAGLDQSNIEQNEVVLPLPEAPDHSADVIREEINRTTGAEISVIITDTWGRPWRLGQVNVAIGISGRRALRDHRGTGDDFGNPLTETLIAEADELAGTAELVMKKTERVPAVLISGLEQSTGETGRGSDLLRARSEDLFR